MIYLIIVIYINTNDINSEANKNSVSLTISSEDAKIIKKELIYNFVDDVITSKIKKCDAMVNHDFIFYLWYDPQSIQLSYSLVSKRDPLQLPFGSKIKIVDDYKEVVKIFLQGCILGFPRVDDLIDVCENEDYDEFYEPNEELLVYAREL